MEGWLKWDLMVEGQGKGTDAGGVEEMRIDGE